MTQNYVPIDISDVPDLKRVAEAVRETGKPHALNEGRETVAVVRPVSRKASSSRARGQKTGIVQADDALFGLIGIGDSGIEGGISGHKHAYQATLRHT